MIGQPRPPSSGDIAHEIMQPVDGGIVIVRQSFAHRSCCESLLVFAYMRSDNGGDFIVVRDSTETPIIGNMVEQLGPFIGLLKVRRHAVLVVGRERKESSLA